MPNINNLIAFKLKTNDIVMKKQYRTIGAVLKIPLMKGYSSYAQILKNDLVFYDKYTNSPNIELSSITNSQILFWATVDNAAIFSGRWRKIGKLLSLDEKILNQPPVYTQDPITKGYTIYNNGIIRIATKEECIGLDYFEVWNYLQIEKRLQLHYNSEKNEYLEKIHNGDVF